VRPRLLLVPAFTELQWTIRPQLDEWADVASFDPPGVGSEPLPAGVELTPEMPEAERRAALRKWREATAARGLEEVDRRGWERFFVVVDGDGPPAAVLLATARPEALEGLAIGHAALSRSTEGERPTMNKEVWAAMTALLRTDRAAFIRYGISQVTAGSVTEEAAEAIVSRYPESDLAVAIWETMGADPEPIEEGLAALDVPFLFAEHVGCLGSTREGFEDIVARFPEAETVSCSQAPSTSLEFAEALREFCGA
jgi:hypothetical protein